MKIPADASQPLSDHTGVVYEDDRGYGDMLPKLLAPGFAGGAVDDAALRHRTEQHMVGGEGGVAKLTSEGLSKGPGATEKFRLSDDVFMYLDEIGALKRLPPNRLPLWCFFFSSHPIFCARDGGIESNIVCAP